MIKPRELVEELAALLGVEETSVRTADLSLTKAGLRQKTQGRYPADVSRADVVRLLLGVMGARMLTEASVDVAAIQGFTLISVSAVKGSADALPAILGLGEAEIRGRPLVDVLCAIIGFRSSRFDAKDAGRVWIEVTVGGTAAIQIEAEAFIGELHFTGAVDMFPRGDMERQSVVGDRTLAWIGQHTSA